MKLDQAMGVAARIWTEDVNAKTEMDTNLAASFAVALVKHTSADALTISELQNPWQPIETAPKDGTRILGFTPYGVEMVKYCEHKEDYPYYWSGAGWTGVEQDSSCSPATISRKIETCQPTHWQPLSPPTNVSGEQS